MKFPFYFLLMTLAASVSFAVDGKAVYTEYHRIIDDQSKAEAERVKQGQAYLRTLKNTEFLEFIRESSRNLGSDDKNEAV